MHKIIAVLMLGALTVACKTTTEPVQQPPMASAVYNRDDWGAWSHVGACDTRETVLKEGQNVVSDKNCKAVSGTWISQYDGLVFTTPSKLQIDHIVPVKEAWLSGGASWSKAKKNQFYNDLDNLIPVSIHSNESKGDQDPAYWLPRQEFVCTYVQRYESVKIKWGLTEDAKEQAAIAKVKVHC